VGDSPIIVGGWIRDWRPAEFEHPGGNSVLPIILDFESVAVYKGWLPTHVTLFDGASLDAHSPPGETRWAGGSGGCGAFDWDPAGQYIIAGIGRSSLVEGAYQLNRLSVVYIGDAPEGEAYDRALARLAMYGQPRPPAAGNTVTRTATTSGSPIVVVGGLALLGFAAAMAAGSLLRPRKQ
jgi:hypothetical protein